jgi:hypothetical protein
MYKHEGLQLEGEEMRSFLINLDGRIRNFPLPKNRPLVPMYEAVVNSIHAIQERRENDESFLSGDIKIEIIRSEQTGMELSPVEGFTIIDNGCGFDEMNMGSFAEADSAYKAKLGGKGVGRFTWLKAFKAVSICSIYKESDAFVERRFTFSKNASGIDDMLIDAPDYNDFKTSVKLDTYFDEYGQYVPKQIDTIAFRIVQHCLVYFLDANCPRIRLIDRDQTITLNDLYRDRYKAEENTVQIQIKTEVFNLLNVKIEDRGTEGNRLYLCANNRLVDSIDLENHIVDLDASIFDNDGFWYIGVLTSAFLDNHVDMNRLSFDLPIKSTELTNDISIEDVITETSMFIEQYLDKYLKPIADEKRKRIHEYATTLAPQYRHLLKYMPDQIAKIKPKLNDDKLDDALYEIKRTFDKSAKSDQRRLFDQLDETKMSQEEYEKYYQEQIQKICDANSSVLAEYVAHRRVIIELFERGLNKKDDGKFNLENYMHNLIYPMRKTSDEIDSESHNLWLIDEKLSYCRYISSDISFNNDPKEKRVDLLILDSPVAVSDDSNDGSGFDSIIIFELKRPMRDDYTEKENPIAQLYEYVRKIKQGTAKDKNGRPIIVNTSTKFYLYAVCDVTKTLMRFIEDRDFTTTPDQMGYYNYNRQLNAYFEILSYNKIVYDAKKRNRVLFNKLGLQP